MFCHRFHMRKTPGKYRLGPAGKSPAVPPAAGRTRPDEQRHKVLRAHYMARYRVR